MLHFEPGMLLIPRIFIETIWTCNVGCACKNFPCAKTCSCSTQWRGKRPCGCMTWQQATASECMGEWLVVANIDPNIINTMIVVTGEGRLCYAYNSQRLFEVVA